MKCLPRKKAKDSAELDSRILGPHLDIMSATRSSAELSSLNLVL